MIKLYFLSLLYYIILLPSFYTLAGSFLTPRDLHIQI